LAKCNGGILILNPCFRAGGLVCFVDVTDLLPVLTFLCCRAVTSFQRWLREAAVEGKSIARLAKCISGILILNPCH
jgi:hypothetical protein